MKNIDLSKLTQNIKVISGRDRGMELREKLKIDEKDIIEEFRNIQDLFTERIQNVNSDIDSLYGEIVEKKPNLMNTLYKYGLDIIK